MKKPQIYYFGDLCYVFNDKNWDKLLEVFDESLGLNFSFINEQGKNVNFFITYTAFGDGCYPSIDHGGDYTTKQLVDLSVDSGTIGLVKIEDCDISIEKILEDQLGIVFEVEENDEVHMFEKFIGDGFFTKYHEIFISQNNDTIFSVITAEEEDDGEYYDDE